MIERECFSIDCNAQDFLSIINPGSCQGWEKYIVFDPAFVEEGRARAIPITSGSQCKVIAFRKNDESFSKTIEKEIFVHSEEDLSYFRYERVILFDNDGRFVVLWDQSDISLTFINKNDEYLLFRKWIDQEFVQSLKDIDTNDIDLEFSDYIKSVRLHYSN